MLNSQWQKEMLIAVVLLLLIVGVVAALIILDKFYWEKAMINLSDAPIVSFEQSAIKTDLAAELAEINVGLLNSDQFSILEKFVNWPPLLADIKKERPNPFNANNK